MVYIITNYKNKNYSFIKYHDINIYKLKP